MYRVGKVETLGSVNAGGLEVFGGNRVNNIFVFPYLVFRDEGNVIVFVVGSLVYLEKDRNANMGHDF